MCPHCRAFITVDDRVCPYCNEKVGARAIDVRRPGDILGGLIPHARFTTTMILLINFGLFAATLLYQGGGESFSFDVDGRTLYRFGAKYLGDGGLPGILTGQWWRLVTAGFLHGGVMHIFMNSWALFDLGAQVEEIYGTSRLLAFYFVTTVCGFALSAWWSPALSIGASAGIFGLIGAMIALGVRHPTPMGSAIKSMYVRWAVYGILFGMLPGFRMDNAAHVGGLASGFGLAWIAGLPRIESAFSERLWRFASYVCLGLTAWSFLQMFLWFRIVR